VPYQPSGERDALELPNWSLKKKRTVYHDKHFRWINSSDQQNMAMHLRAYGENPGYEITQGATVQDTEKICGELGLNEAYIDRARNRIVYGDLVLAWLPMHERERRDDEMLYKAANRTKDADEAFYAQFQDNVPPRIARPFIREEGEIEDRKTHATRDGKPFMSTAQPPAKTKTSGGKKSPAAPA